MAWRNLTQSAQKAYVTDSEFETPCNLNSLPYHSRGPVLLIPYMYICPVSTIQSCTSTSIHVYLPSFYHPVLYLYIHTCIFAQFLPSSPVPLHPYMYIFPVSTIKPRSSTSMYLCPLRTIHIHLVDHVLQLSLCRVLTQ